MLDEVKFQFHHGITLPVYGGIVKVVVVTVRVIVEVTVVTPEVVFVSIMAQATSSGVMNSPMWIVV